jgi:hypothetical protein
LEGDIQDVGSVGGPNLNLIELQWDLTTLTSKYELLQHEACHSREGYQKLKRERAIWVLERARMTEEFKVLKSSEVLQIQGLHYTRRKTEINDSINDSFLSRLGHKLPINDSNNEIGFELLWTSRLGHLSRLCTRDYLSSKV